VIVLRTGILGLAAAVFATTFDGGRLSVRADETAKPAVEQSVHVALNARSELVVPGHADPLVKAEDIRKYLGDEYDRLKKAAEKQKFKFDPEVVIRADKDARFKRVHEVMTEAKNAGFRVSVRADARNK